jgi:hypothetical protein
MKKLWKTSGMPDFKRVLGERREGERDRVEGGRFTGQMRFDSR